jgi:hypothetical protein
MRRARQLAVLLLVAGAVVASGAAPAWAEAAAVRDCQQHSDALAGHYTIPELQNALATIPPILKEYGACYSVIQNQLLKQLGDLRGHRSAGGSGSGGSFISTPVLVVLIVIVLGGAGAAFAASRRRSGGGDDSGGGPQAPAT